MLGQALFHYGQDTAVHRFDAGIAFDGDDPRRLALRDGAVLVVDAAEKCCIERFEAVLILTGDGGCGLVALSRTGEGGVEVGQQKKGEVGVEAAELAVQRKHTRGAELASCALVGLAPVAWPRVVGSVQKVTVAWAGTV